MTAAWSADELGDMEVTVSPLREFTFYDDVIYVRGVVRRDGVRYAVVVRVPVATPEGDIVRVARPLLVAAFLDGSAVVMGG